MRNVIIKSINILFLILCLIGFSSTDTHAGLKKKLGLDSFQNPPNWSKPFDPGSLLAEQLKKAIISKMEYRLVSNASGMSMAPEDKPQEPNVEGTEDSMMAVNKKAEIMEVRHPAQLLVQGRILLLNSKVVPGAIKKAVLEEQTELVVEVTLMNPRTKRNIAVRYFKRDTQREQKLPGEYTDINEPSFRNSSIGSAMELIGNDIMTFIHETLSLTPFDADIIEVEDNGRLVVINAGSNDGVQAFDLFRVYWVKSNYQDIGTQVDLGDRPILKGMIKIETVQANFAVARIMAGESIKPGSVIREKWPRQ